MQNAICRFRRIPAPLGFATILTVAAILLASAPAQAQTAATLGIQPVSTNRVQLFWQPVTGFEQVQSVTNLAETNNWQTLTNSPLFQSPLMSLQQAITNPQSFFRLANGAQPNMAPTNLPDPSTIVPPFPPNTQISFGGAISFLYSGSNTVQLGTTSGSITQAQAAVLRGRVLTQNGAPLSGVHVYVPSHPEYGYTYTRGNGLFDLAINGGGQVVVDFQLAGYCPAQRQVFVLKQGFGHVPDVMLKTLDPAANPITFGSNSPAQWAASSTQTDANGTRTAKLYVPPGTSAMMVLPNGSAQPVSTLTIRITEFTVGSNGPSTMPALLPSSSSYSYCADFTADEALAAGAETVVFSQPLYSYLTNYLGIPVGLYVPNGYYDRSLGAWVPLNNGQIVKIVGVSNGLAEISFNTNGTVADPGTLATNQFTANELIQLATAFPIGSSLTRVAMSHFTVEDRNFAPVPGNPANPQTPADKPAPPGNESNPNYGTLRTAEQVFEETIPVAGEPFSLHYSSARVPDYRVFGQVSFPLLIPVSQPIGEYFLSTYVSLIDMKVDTDMAGVTNEIIVPATNYGYITNIVVPWDKSWAYGTNLPGAASTVAQIDLDFHYFNTGALVAAEEQAAFNYVTGGYNDHMGSLFQQFASLTSEAVHDASYDIDDLTSFTQTLTIPDHRALGMGGWSLGPQHYYDSVGQILYLGDGTIRKSPPLADSLTVAEDFANRQILSVAPASDGSCYLTLAAATGQPVQIVRYIPNQPLQAVTGGSGTPSFDGVGGVVSVGSGVPANGYPATNVGLYYAGGAGELAIGPDDTLYFSYNSTTIWHIDRQGLLRPVVQGGTYGVLQPDGAYGTNAVMVNGTPHISVGPDGSVYYAERPTTIQTTNAAWNGRSWCLIRRLGTDGRIYTVAGQGGPTPQLFVNAFPGDGQYVDLGFGKPASAAQLQSPLAIHAARDGSIYWMSGGDTTQTPFIDRITPSGMMEPVANYPQSYALPTPSAAPTGFDDDGVLVANMPASSDNDAYFIGSEMSQGLDGSLYFSTESVYYGAVTEFIWQISPDGYIHRVSGMFYGNWEGIARDVYLGAVGSAAQTKVGSDGTLYAAVARDTTFNANGPYDWQLLRMSTRTPALGAGDIAIASDDATEFYIFDSGGHHLFTINTLNGTTNWQFAYDANNLLVSMKDANGLVTTITRDGAGRPQAITGPYGQTTKLTVDENDFLSSVTDPAGNVTSLGNSAGGLVKSVTGPRGFTYNFSYDALGRCIKAADPSGGNESLGLDVVNSISFTNFNYVVSDYIVGDTNAQGAATTITSVLLGNNTTLTETESPLGVTDWEATALDGDLMITNADGTRCIETFVGDPRFPAQTHLISSITAWVPGGLAWQENSIFNIETNYAGSIVAQWTNIYDFNGNNYTVSYNGSNLTYLSPDGRQETVLGDSKGRPISVSEPGLATRSLTYDSYGRLANVIDQSAEGTRTLAHTYDLLGRLNAITDALGETKQFAYDTANHLRQLTLDDGRAIGFQCDSEGNVDSVTMPGGQAYTFTYDGVGQLTNFTPPLVSEDDSVHYAFDTRRNLTQARFPDGQTVSLGWNADNNLANVALGSGQALTFAYTNSTGQLAGVTASNGNSMTFQYQGLLLENMSWLGAVSGSVGVQYNSYFLPSSETVDSLSPVSFKYDGDLFLTNIGPLALARDSNEFVVAATIGLVGYQQQHDDLGRMTNSSVTVGGSNFWSETLAYDALDRITNKVESIGGAATRARQFTYDLDSRLSQVYVNGALAATYTYDTNGNRVTRSSESGTYDAQNRVVTYDGTGFAWSPNGYLLSASAGGQTTNYTYDIISGALTSVALPGGATLTYVLDPFGRRIGKEVNGILQSGWLYDGDDRPVAQITAAGTNGFYYSDDTSTPAFITSGSNTYAVVSDEGGSVRFVINAVNGAVAEALDYDEFGRVTSDSNPGLQPFGFAGGFHDTDTGLDRFGARDYNPQTGTWTARDPIAFASGGFNLYAYASFDPVNRADPAGTGPGHPNPSVPDDNDGLSPAERWVFNLHNKVASNISSALGWMKGQICGQPIVNPNAEQITALQTDPTYNTQQQYQQNYQNGQNGLIEIGVAAAVSPISLPVPGGIVGEKAAEYGLEHAARHAVSGVYNAGGE